MTRAGLANLDTILDQIQKNIDLLSDRSNRVKINLAIQIRNADIGIRRKNWFLFNHLQDSLIGDVQELVNLSAISERHLKTVIETLQPLNVLPGYEKQKETWLEKIRRLILYLRQTR